MPLARARARAERVGNPITEEYLDHGDYPVPKNQPAWTIDLNLTWYSWLWYWLAWLLSPMVMMAPRRQAGRTKEDAWIWMVCETQAMGCT